MNAAVTITRGGVRVDLDAPRREMIVASDIAEHLAKQPMYCGATWGFYSIAQHSTLVATLIGPGEGPLASLYALLHHAFAAYDGASWPRLMPVIHEAFDLDWPPPRATQRAIETAHPGVEMTERRQLCTGCEAEVARLEAGGAKSLRSMIKPLAWDRAMDGFVKALRCNAVAAQLSPAPVWGDLL